MYDKLYLHEKASCSTRFMFAFCTVVSQGASNDLHLLVVLVMQISDISSFSSHLTWSALLPATSISFRHLVSSDRVPPGNNLDVFRRIYPSIRIVTF